MNRRSFVHIVCSPRPRVGKTLVARLLVDYFLAQGRPVVAFDTNANEPALADIFGDDATVTDIRVVEGQVGLIDRLLEVDDVPKVVDLWSRVYERFFDLIEEIGFIEEARRLAIQPIVYFIDDADPVVSEAHARLRSRFDGLAIVSVRNEASSSSGPFPTGRPNSPVVYPFETHLQIPPLEPILRRAIETPGFSLSAFLRQPSDNMSIVVRAAVRAWTSRVFVQLQNFELRLSLSDAEYLR